MKIVHKEKKNNIMSPRRAVNRRGRAVKLHLNYTIKWCQSNISQYNALFAHTPTP